MLDFRQQAEEFEKFLQEQTSSFFKKEPQTLYEPCTYMLSIGGKRIRPAVCLMSSALFDNSNNTNAYWTALAVELFHNFTLIHDDIMDNAPLRRGKTTVYKKYNEPTAILSGDLMSIYAYTCLQNTTPEILAKILPVFNKTAIEVCEGQQKDMDFETMEIVSKADYLNMIQLKTAVLLAASMKMGALCSGTSEDQANLIYDFGINLGVAFQLQDDYLDSFGESASIGKQIGGDILADKKTFLAIDAFEKADQNQKKILAFDGHETDKVKEIQDLYRTLKTDENCKQAIEDYTNKAMIALNSIKVSSEKKKPFIDLLDFLMIRNH
ncbi:MAG TPA: polyprenyl synthetase family protein [Edaphocola sp.]|nr:polyprenyl synthetase family protein [Edaphocola sp.]